MQALATQKKPKAVPSVAKSIQLTMKLSGDINETYQFGGLLGSALLGAPLQPNPPCENKALFREALHDQKKSLEIQMTLVCTNDGQKVQLETHRFFIDLKKAQPIVSLSYFTMKIKKIKVEILDLSIKSPKLK